MDKGWGRGDEIARGQGLKRKYDLWENTGMMEIAKALKQQGCLEYIFKFLVCMVLSYIAFYLHTHYT